jgi:hypothetical protein
MNDFVINIRDIANIKYFVTTGPQPPNDHIEHNHDPSMANMAKVIHRHTADIHFHLARYDGLKDLF